MKLIHCADLHLDSRLNRNLGNEKAAERRRELTRNFCDLVDYAANNSVSGILICGDMFDTSRVSAFTRNAVLDSITKNPQITFFLLKGNHDSESFIDELEEIPDNLKLFSDRFSCYDLEGVKIYGAELYGGNSDSLQENFSPNPLDINIVMLHGQESESTGGERAELINLRNFKDKGINYLALGHVHEYKVADLDGACRYCYPGCLEGRGFDEPGDHGFVLLDIDTDTGVVRDEFIPFAKRRVYCIDVDITGLNNTFDILSKVKETVALSPAKKEDMVRIALKGESDAECEKDINFLNSQIGNDHYFAKVVDETGVSVRIEDYMLDSTLKGEFVRTVMASDLDDERKGVIVREGIALFNE